MVKAWATMSDLGIPFHDRSGQITTEICCHFQMSVEGREYPGIPLVYPFYRDTPLGTALMETLDEFKESRMMRDKQADMFLEEFDRAMTQHLDQLPPEEFQISRGTVVDCRAIDLYYRVFMRPAVIQFPEGSYTSESLEIIAVKGVKQERKKEKEGKK